MARLIQGSPHDAISIFSNALLYDIVLAYLGGDYRDQLLRPDFWNLFAAPEDFDRALDWDWRPTPVLSLPLFPVNRIPQIITDKQTQFGCP